MCFLSGTAVWGAGNTHVCGLELGLTREFGGGDAEGLAGSRAERRSPLLVRVCVPSVGMCGRGLRTGEGGFFWEISIFLKTTILINH